MAVVAIVTGSRNWTDKHALWEVLDDLKPALVVEGGAKGADAFARDWCDERGITCVEVPALWTAHGKTAGPKRNRVMLRVARALADARNMDVEVVACPLSDSVGTVDMMTIARNEGLCIYQVVP